MNNIKFAIAFNIGTSDEQRIEACTMYQKAFGATKISECSVPGGDIHIIMEIGGIKLLLGPGGKVEKTTENAMCCEYNFDNEEDLKKAYKILSADALRCSLEGPLPWAKLLGLVVDKFGVSWALYFR